MQDVFLWYTKPLDRSWQGPSIFFENFYWRGQLIVAEIKDVKALDQN